MKRYSVALIPYLLPTTYDPQIDTLKGKPMRKTAFVIIAFTLIAAFAALAQPAAPTLTLDQVRAKLEENYKSINTLSANFEQELWSATQGRVISKGEGSVAYKKPGHMVWKYVKPEEHLYLTDGDTIWDYAPVDKEATVYQVKESLYKSFLLGISDLKKDFEIAFHSGRAMNQAGLYQLDLTPRDPLERETIGRITIYLDPATFLISETETIDALGNRNVIRFKDLVKNPALPDEAFKFTPPKGVRVIKPDVPKPATPPKPAATPPKPAPKPQAQPPKPAPKPAPKPGAPTPKQK